jgi:tetratricopeptide (TPR) repeat protein
MGKLGNYYAEQYERGNRDVIAALSAEEANLLHARQLARKHGWWRRVISTMQGLYQLYDHTGRRAEWARLVEEIVPDFVDPDTDGPLPGREEQWRFATEYRAQLAMEARQWAEAERLQRAKTEWAHQRAAPALAMPPEALDDVQRNVIRMLAVSLESLGHILREQDKPECVTAYEEAISLYQHIGDRPAEAIAAFNLGHAYLILPALRDLAQAERWYKRALELFEHAPRQAHCLGQLGNVAHERFKEAQAAKRPEEELLQHINDALRFYHQALDLLPPDAVDDLAVTHNLLGNIYSNAGDLDRALPHYRESIRYREMQGNLYGAAQTRFNVALVLAEAGRLSDAREYAHAALRNFQTYGDRAADKIEKTQGLIAKIEGAMESLKH